MNVNSIYGIKVQPKGLYRMNVNSYKLVICFGGL